MSKNSVQLEMAKTTPSPHLKPRWRKRILENVRLAGVATVLAGSLALSACGGMQVKAVPPTKARNPICDPKIGIAYVRPDGMDSILSRPTDCGQDIYCPYTIPILALAIFYHNEAGSP